MKEKTLANPLLAIICVLVIACVAISGCSSAKATEKPGKAASEAAFAESVSDKSAGEAGRTASEVMAPAGSSEVEEGFISLERMREQVRALEEEDPSLDGNRPSAYFADGVNPYYNEIVALGPAAIPQLKQAIADTTPGYDLERYLLSEALYELEDPLLLATGPSDCSLEEFISLDHMRAQVRAITRENPLVGMQSATGAYIADGINPYYDEIVALGPDAIPELKRELAESPYNGLEEYLFAIAIEEILNSQGESAFDGDDRPWSGKEYLEFLEDDSK